MLLMDIRCQVRFNVGIQITSSQNVDKITKMSAAKKQTFRLPIPSDSPPQVLG
jgi:hypothetical protein